MMLKKVQLFLFVLAGSLLPHSNTRAAEPRTALLIGNSAYVSSPLANPTHDATDMAEVLRGAGFEVTLQTNANQKAMRDAIRAFGDTLKQKGGVGLFFFAGHGLQIAGENYIVPIGETITSLDDVVARAVTAAEAVDVMAEARNALNIVILDACRDNPLASGRNATRGLSRIDSSASLFVSFSTSPGTLALDGSGRNSPYTKHLARSISTPYQTLEETFKNTLKGVYQETNGQQTPWISSSFFGEFSFRPSPALAAPTQQSVANLPPRPQLISAAAAAISLGGIYRVEGTNPNGTRYRGMTTIVASGEQVRFTWWIDKEKFSGIGEFAGRMLVVEWGSRHPVVYTFGPGTYLNGEWADGSASDRLDLYARPAKGDMRSPGGRYRVAGRNANGERYAGKLSIVRKGDRFLFHWNVGSSTYHGVGTLEGNIMSVDWGSSQPIIYALTDNGSLKGLWAGGLAEELAHPDR